ncbi:MAG: MOSC domain-containing protein [Nitrospira sp.]|nr:MOSC domain-containing protein [Nitrospira sp.]
MQTSGGEERLISVQIGMPQPLGQERAPDPMDRPWTTGFFKLPVTEPIWLGTINLKGDGQADLKNHGGPEKAVNVYPFEHYPYWQQVLGTSSLPFGAFGENFTTENLLESEVCLGDIFEVGQALVQISQPRQPCWKLARRWRRKDLSLLVQESGRTGWYFRVLKEGTIQSGSRLRLVERSHPEWTVAAANEVMHRLTEDLDAAQSLASCPALAVRWRETLMKRVETRTVGSSTARLYGPNLLQEPK